MKKTFAFDIDGTIITRESLIDPDVKPFFENENLANHNLLFVTGNTKKVIDALKTEMQTNFPHLKNIKPYYIALNGSIIYSQTGEILRKFTFNKKEIAENVKQVYKEFPEVNVFYTTENNYFVSPFCDEENIKQAKAFVASENKKGAIGLPFSFIEGDVDEILDKIGDLYCVMFHSKHLDKILEMQKEKYKNSEIAVFLDTKLNICILSAGSKWTALQNLCELEKGKDDGYPQNAEDIIYFGDGENDMECMQNCKLSFARGKDFAENVLESAKYNVVNLEEVARKLL